MGVFTIDLSRAPNVKERKALISRVDRLEGGYGESVARVIASTTHLLGGKGPLASKGFRVRPAFSYKATPPPGDFSDRKVPSHDLRPPATRISSSQGSTLRLYLMSIAIAQMGKTAGGTAGSLPIIGEAEKDKDLLGLTDIVATNAVKTQEKNHYLHARDKRARSIRNSLTTLSNAGLVDLGSKPGGGTDFENYTLLDETGGSVIEPSVYKVPRPHDVTITLPPGFITKSWLHVLEDSEITLLLMIACGLRSLSGTGVAISGEDRVLHYGIGPDTYARARKTLEWFGLIDVTESDRQRDGRTEGDKPHQLHRFAIIPSGFDHEALTTAKTAITEQLARRQ